MLWTIGLDYHLRTSTVHILNHNGKTVKTQTIRGDWRKLLHALKQIKQPFRIVYEASCGYGHLHEKLARMAQQVVVAHPGKVRLIYRSKRKNDRIDAQKLATLLYLGAVPPVYVPDVNVRAWRELIQFRRTSVDKRTRIKNQIRTLLRSCGVIKPREIGGLWSHKGLHWLAQLKWDTSAAQLRCEMLLEELREADNRVARLTAELDQIASEHPGVTLLRSIPGVGPRTAEAIVAWVDNPHRFARSKSIGAYFGLVPCQDSSAGVNRLGHITKEGPATARRMLVEAVWQGIRRDDHLREHFQRVAGDKQDRQKIALVATAHHLLRCMLAMLKTGETWNPQPPRCAMQNIRKNAA